jgi:XRE family transcriptional regulator, regulator of sulfur utilization
MGRRLRKLRKEQDMSRAELAHRAGISREYVRRLEAGDFDPTVGTVQKLARALGVPLMELLG